MTIKNIQCTQCKALIKDSYIMASPSRSSISPVKSTSLPFCNNECKKQYDKDAYPFWAELDRNASDSTCFIHDHWEKDSLHRNIRVGRCKIIGKEVRVEPNQPGDNSGQPKECYEHFELRT